MYKISVQGNNCTKGNGSGDALFDFYLDDADNSTCNNCTDCLGMSQDNYNLLYAIYAWT